MAVAEIQGLTVRYGNNTALDNLTVSIPDGCIGLLGPNGSGKTTLIKTLLGFLDPAAGGGTVMGANILTEGPLIRQRVGLMPEQDCHIPGLTAVGYVAYAGELAGMPPNQSLRRAHEVLEYCGLGEARYRNVETFSTGMKQRIKLAQALVHGPKLLLLDEPTNGLDPRGRAEMLELIRSVSHGKGVSVIVSSHLLPDIERTCDEVVVIYKGRLQQQGLISELKKIEGRPIDIELREATEGFPVAAIQKGFNVLSHHRSSYRLQKNGPPEDVMRDAFAAALAAGAQVRGYQIAQRSLEEAFMEAIS